MVSQVGPQFIELDMAINQLLEEAVVQLLGVHPGPRQPGPQRSLFDPGYSFQECEYWQKT